MAYNNLYSRCMEPEKIQGRSKEWSEYRSIITFDGSNDDGRLNEKWQSASYRFL